MKTKKYLLVAGVIAALLGLGVHVAEGASKSPGQIAAGEIPKLTFFAVKRSVYIAAAIHYATQYLDVLVRNFEGFILMNPSPNNPLILDVIRFFVGLLQPFYILALTVTGFYLILVSSSPSGRAKAKSTFIKLIISLTFISFTPYILHILLFLTENLAGSILAQSNLGYFSNAFNTTVTNFKWWHKLATFIDVEIGFYTFIPMFLTVWGTYLMLIVRYFALVLWIVVFPVAIFLYSFSFTKTLGRNMLEQTILWSFLQVFNAVIIAAASTCMISKPAGFMVIDLPMGTGLDVIMIISVLALGLTPAVMLVWFRGFLP